MPCGHTYCSGCIQDRVNTIQMLKDSNDAVTFVCPDDGLECQISDVSTLAKNHALLQELSTKPVKQFEQLQENDYDLLLSEGIPTPKEFKQPQPVKRFADRFQSKIGRQKSTETCADHGRVPELICLDDRSKVCSHCALFGAHKGHDVREPEEIQLLIKQNTESLQLLVSEVTNSKNALIQSKKYWHTFNTCRDKQTQLQNQIQQQFKAWRTALRHVETKMLDDLQQAFQIFDYRYFQKAKLDNSKLVRETDQWLIQTNQLLEATVNMTRQGLDLLNTEEVDKLTVIADSIKHKVINYEGGDELDGLEQKFNQIYLEFDPQFDKKVRKMCSVVNQLDSSQDKSEQLSNPNLSANLIFQDEVIRGSAMNILGPDISRISWDNQPDVLVVQESTNTSDSLTGILEPTRATSVQKPNQFKAQRHGSLILNQSIQQTPPPLKRMQTKDSQVASAFRLSDEVNLSSKQISDNSINEIVNTLKRYPNTRSIDLSNNKITDEGIQHLAKGIAENSQLHVLILANNKISEKCIEPLAATLRVLKNLKALDLQGNSITNRVAKNKIKNVLTWVEITF